MYQTKALVPENPLLVLPFLAKEIGLNEAIILQQIHYWAVKSNHIYENKKWVYNSYPEWQKQFPFWSISTIKRTIQNLEKQQIIESGNYNKLAIDRTKWYTINYEKIPDISSPKDQEEPTNSSECAHQGSKLSSAIPETTTETEDLSKDKKNKVFPSVSSVSKEEMVERKKEQIIPLIDKKNPLVEKMKEYIDRWNENPQVRKHTDSSKKVYKRICTLLNQLERGTFGKMNSIDKEWMDKNNIPFDLLNHKFGKIQIMDTLDKLALLFLDGYTGHIGKKYNNLQSLDNLLYYPQTQESLFLKVFIKPPKPKNGKFPEASTNRRQSYLQDRADARMMST